MAGWHYDLFLVASGPVDHAALAARLVRDIPAMKSPSPKLLLWGTADGNRIDFWTDHAPPQLLARFDLRTPSDGFRQLILDVAREFQLRLVNADDVAMEPTDAALLAEIQSSPAQAFVLNPPAEDDEDE